MANTPAFQESITVEPITPGIGAIVHGVALQDTITDDGLFAAIHALWMQHLVLFFREQRLTPEEHVAFGRRFGEFIFILLHPMPTTIPH